MDDSVKALYMAFLYNYDSVVSAIEKYYSDQIGSNRSLLLQALTKGQQVRSLYEKIYFANKALCFLDQYNTTAPLESEWDVEDTDLNLQEIFGATISFDSLNKKGVFRRN